MTRRAKKTKASPAYVSPLSRFHAEIDGTGTSLAILISGVRNIPEFYDGGALIKISGMTVSVKGKGLAISVFEGRCVELIGKITEVEFIYDKN